MKAILKFPESNDGTIEGISDAGIETFTGNPLGGLAREQAQNSIDARKEGVTEPVKVRYELLEIPVKKVPGCEELSAAIVASQRYWDNRCSKTKRILHKASKVLNKSTIHCLRISDRNTTGLTGSNLNDQGNWFNLTKASGVSEKGSGKGGSFGIGKNAFFANSALRTVFFSTHDSEGRWAFQGVTKLVSHKSGKKMTRATGFLGDPMGYLPITGKTGIPKQFQCEDIGTDIIIVGFEPREGWQKDLMAAFAENFFVAIHDGLLEVSIQREDDPSSFHELSTVTLGNVIEALANENNKRYQALLDQYDTLLNPETLQFETEIEGLGKLELKLLKRDGARKTIAMFRKTGMKIFEKDRFRTPVEFTGVFKCSGEEGNALLRRLEPPSHDKWEPERYDDVKTANRFLKAINEWTRQCVASLQVPDSGDQQAIPGLERFLPDDFEDPFDKPDRAYAEGDPRPKDLQGVKGLVRTPKFKPPRLGVAQEETDTYTVTEESESTGVRSEKNGNGGALKEIEIDYRTFHDPTSSKYRMMARFKDAGSYDVLLYAVGDDGRAEPVVVREAKLLIDGRFQRVSVTAPNRITKLKIDVSSAVEIQFASPSTIPRTMLARVHRHD